MGSLCFGVSERIQPLSEFSLDNTLPDICFSTSGIIEKEKKAYICSERIENHDWLRI